MFMILDSEKMEIFYSDNYTKVNEIQEEQTTFHPVELCDLMIDEDGYLFLHDGRGNVQMLDWKYRFIEFIKED